MTIINLTPHNVHYWEGPRIVRTFEPDGTIARVEMEKQGEWEQGGVKFKSRPVPKASPLPPGGEGVVFIVSSMVREANPHRKDLVSPSDLVRGTDGSIIGCRAFDTNLQGAFDPSEGRFGI